MMKSIQERVLRRMAREGNTIADLAARTGRSYSDVRRSLLAPHAWRLDRLFDYARALGAAPGDFLPSPAAEGESPETPDRIRAGSPAQRIAGAYAAGLAVRALHRIGAANRKPRR